MDDNTQSSKKEDSNRKNALKSTGPRTERGKRISRWNALKHGLVGKAVVIQEGERKENAAEFKSLLAQLRKTLEPVGVLEEILVEQIATSYWRLRRALRCEAGEIVAAQSNPFDGEGGLGFAALETVGQSRTVDSNGAQERLKILETLSQNLEKNEPLSEEGLNRLYEKFGPKSALARHLSLLNKGLLDSKEGPERERFDVIRGEMLEYIGHEREVLEGVRKQLKKKEELESEARMASLNLPSGKVADKIIRYEVTLERQMHKAIETLDRLQSGRKRQPVPAPGTGIFSEN